MAPTTPLPVMCVSLLLFMSISSVVSSIVLGRSMESGMSLYPNWLLESGDCSFTMQDDCNLVLQKGGGSLWMTNTTGKGKNCRATLLNDGRLQIVNDHVIQMWISENDGGKGGNYALVVYEIGNAVIFDSDQNVVWAANKFGL